MTALVDSNVLIDSRHDRSRRHDRARRIVAGIDSGTLPTARVTDYVLLETLNLLHSRSASQLAVDTQDRLAASRGFELVQSAQKDFDRAVELHEQFESLSFGDATIAAYMDRTECAYLYSFDDDFDALDWVARLESATDPFDT